ASHFSVLDECLLEGVLSRVWQAWCNFCRSCVIESCVGTIDGAGAIIEALPDAASDAHVSGAAIRAKQGANPPYWGHTNTLLRAEPTWGDVDVLAKVLPRLRPTNFNQLLAAFSSGHPSAKALRLIRNGAAHCNAQSLGEIQTLRSLYIVFPIGHPTHALFWIEPRSKDFLVTRAIEELRDVGFAAVS
ncbi:MAG: hypothetical protein ABIO65_02545, partial [Nitrospiria bacterium]